MFCLILLEPVYKNKTTEVYVANKIKIQFLVRRRAKNNNIKYGGDNTLHMHINVYVYLSFIPQPLCGNTYTNVCIYELFMNLCTLAHSVIIKKTRGGAPPVPPADTPKIY